ncbi:hypothetical protein Leryth_012129 [Lithospermum erythrorhizon]|nr:hypothetical protein Leryth_012129 [Lithospermum erythrorhizon]
MLQLFLSVFVKGVASKEEITIFLNSKMVAFSVLATLPIMFILNFFANLVFPASIQGGAEEVIVEQIKEVVDEDGNEMQCAVCLHEVCKGEKVKILTKCRHGYHVTCIDSWFLTNPSCPICRSESFFEGFCRSFLGLSTEDNVRDGHYFY